MRRCWLGRRWEAAIRLDGVRVLLVEAGFQEHVAKPVNARLLVEVVTTLAAPALHGSP